LVMSLQYATALAFRMPTVDDRAYQTGPCEGRGKGAGKVGACVMCALKEPPRSRCPAHHVDSLAPNVKDLLVDAFVPAGVELPERCPRCQQLRNVLDDRGHLVFDKL
jgi:hypothetical protein